VQREVATALPRTRSRDYGLLSATAQLTRALKAFICAGAFHPPKCIPRIAPPMAPRQRELGRGRWQVSMAASKMVHCFLKLSFGQKRKTLWNNLNPTIRTSSARRPGQAGVKPAARAET